MADELQQALAHNSGKDAARYSAPTILRLPGVIARTGLSRSSIYSWIADGKFPKPVSLGPRAVGWVVTEIEQWIRQRIEDSRRPQPPSRSGRRSAKGASQKLRQ